MILVSNHLLYLDEHFVIPEEAVIRINIAWVQDIQQLEQFLNVPHDIFIDYPEGRNKPPIPKLTYEQVIKKIKATKKVKYLAVSNIEFGNIAGLYRDSMFNVIEFIPKIETKKGVYNLEAILQGAKSNYIMLDTEDLFSDCKNTQEYLHLIEEVEYTCKQVEVKILKLQGVVFSG